MAGSLSCQRPEEGEWEFSFNVIQNVDPFVPDGSDDDGDLVVFAVR